MTPKTERAATAYVDNIISRVMIHSAAPVTPSRVAALALARIRHWDYRLESALALHQLQQIARSRLNVHFHLLLQAQALATIPMRMAPAPTVTRAAA